MAFFSYESGLGWGWVQNLATPGVVRSWMAPTTAIAFVGTSLAHLVHVGVGLGGFLSVTRFLGLLIAGVAGIWLLWNSDRIGALKAMGLTLLLFVVLGPVDQPWYLSWALVLLAPVAVGPAALVDDRVGDGDGISRHLGAAQLGNLLIHGDPLSIVLTLLWLLVVLTIPLARWERRVSTTTTSDLLVAPVASGV